MFFKKADKATTFDKIVAYEIENLLKLDDPAEYCELLFNNLLKARNDISQLDSLQILYKDMKMLKSNNKCNDDNNEKSNNIDDNNDDDDNDDNNPNSINIALPGFPILVQDYIKLDNVEENLKKFAKIQNVQIILLIGMQINCNNNENNDENTIKRDLGLINMTTNNDKLYQKILYNLINHNNPNLELIEYTNCKFMNGKFFKQNNIKATRKQILPIIKSILDNQSQE